MGGLRLIDKKCNRCCIIYKGIHNQHLCNDCKTIGFDRICKYCNTNFISKSRYTYHCNTCKELQIWKRGKFPNRAEKISKSKLEFFQTDKGKQTANQVGNINSKKMKEFLLTDKGIESLKIRSEKISSTMKRKIAEGIYTPKITNSFTHWNAIIDTGYELRKFRSSWEACIWFCNQHWKYENIRIPYFNKNNIQCSYIVDFYDETTSTLYEVKPNSRISSDYLKLEAALRYCKENKLNFILITENNLLNYINPDIFFGENLKQLEKCLK